MTVKKSRLHYALLTSAAGLALASGPLYAQSAEAGDPDLASEETSEARSQYDDNVIIVTATKQSQSINDVPISISAYDQQSMDKLGVRDINDIATLTPGLQIESVRERASGTNIAIRGISSRIGANTTGLYIDDAPIQVRIIGYDATNVYPQVFDLERVEVLRGPQGTLYGAGSMGGNVRFITPRPDLNDTQYYGRAEVSTTQGGALSYEAGLAFGTPIVEDVLAFRASGWHRRNGGWVDRADMNTGEVTEENANSDETTVLRGALTFAPSDTTTITAAVFYQDMHVDDASSYWSTLSDRDEGVFKNGYPLYQIYDDEFVLPSLEVAVDLGSVTLTSSTSYFKRRAYNEWDYSTVVPAILTRGAVSSFPGYTATSYFVDKQENFAEELRLSSNDPDAPVSFVAGIYYGYRKQTSFQTLDTASYPALAALTGLPPLTAGPSALFPDAGKFGLSTLLIENAAIDESIAAFGEVTFRLTDQLSLTTGLRVERARLDFTNEQSGLFNGGNTGGTSNPKVTPITPKVSLKYEIDDRNMVYATAAKGYRIGGGNARLPETTCRGALDDIGIDQAPSSYDPDSLWSYEIGTKASLFGNAVQMNASAFYIDWSNIQQQVFPPCGFQYVENVGGLRSKGFDLQVSADLTPEFRLGLQAGYVHARFTEDAYPNDNPALQPLVREGNSPLGLRPWTFVFSGDYETDIGPDTSLYANATVTYLSEDKNETAFLDDTAVRDVVRINPEAQTLVGARLGVRYDRFDISIFAKNLLNSHALTSRNHDYLTSTLLKETSVRPRTLGLTATVRY